ncbi:MAG: transposase [Sphingobacteriales bacterium]|nr:MAG: transposase [Sphingobacteriales bacterium]
MDENLTLTQQINMRKERRTFSGSFKARVALESLAERKTITQLANEHQVLPKQISAWKKQLMENSAKIFESDAVIQNPEDEKQKEELYNQIGRLKVENDWLKKKSAQFIR